MSSAAGDLRHLLVPIRVDALALGQSPPRWARLAPDYSHLKKEWLRGDELRSTLLSPGQVHSALPQGIHLHFRLPPALTHGVASGNGSTARATLDFPRSPNRWLVQRYRKIENGTWSSRMWIVRSDAPAAAAVSSVVLPASGPANSGKSMRLVGFGALEEILPGSSPKLDLGDTPSLMALTAVTGGDAGFSAHYPSCHGMFGFHDDVKEDGKPVDKATLMYLVSGWYSSPSDDPWRSLLANADKPERPNGPTGLEKIAGWMAEHRLRFLCGEKTTLSELPSSLLCYGWIRNLDWDRGRDYWLHAEDDATRREFKSFADPAAYSVEMGNTVAEALAARMKPPAAKTDPSLFEDVVTAFQGGLLAQGLAPADIDAELHRLSFVPLPSGTLWTVEEQRAAADPEVDARPSRAPAVLPRHLQDKLDALNAAQTLNDRLERQRAGYRWELYALWHRLVQAQRNESSGREMLARSMESLQQFLDAFPRLPIVVEAQEALKRAEKDLGAEIERLAQVPDAVFYAKAQKQAPPYYIPNDPVLIVSGPALKQYGTFTFEGTVPCRVAGEVLSAIERSGGSIVPSALFDAAHLAHLERIAPWARRLLAETCLIDAMGDPDTGAPIAIFGRDASAARLPLNAALLPNLGVFDWKCNPWIPQYLVWQADWQSDYAAGSLHSTESSSQWITGRWQLDGAPVPEPWRYRRRADLLPRSSQLGSPAAEPATLRGYTILSRPALQTGAQTPILAPNESRPADGETAATLEQIRARLLALTTFRPSAAQTAAGYHDALIMRHLGDQLPPLRWSDPHQWRGEDNHSIDDKIPDGFAYSPDLAVPFFPIRAGRLTVTGLWIVDAFGQKVQIPQGCPQLQSGRLKAASGNVSFALRPRFAQPMRLVFAPEPADNPPGTAHPSSSVCGWLICNRLEQSMTLYSAGGRLLGALQKKFKPADGETLFYWIPAPGADIDPGMANPHLSDFHRYVLGLTLDPGDDFSHVVGQAIAATDERTPDSDQTVSLLVGRPLALVRASLGFETAGVPALDQNLSWTQSPTQPFADLLAPTLGHSQPGNCSLLDTGGFETVQWPVLLGDAESRSDGLIGFFKGSPGAPRPFYAARGLRLKTEHQGVLTAAQDLVLNGRNRLLVTLLMDPFAQVHATTGALPRASFALPAGEAAIARHAWEVFFQTAPVLGAGTTPRVPKPSDDYGEWSWVCRPAVTTWTTDSNLVSASDRESDAIRWPTISEGWLKLRIAPVRILNFWQKSEGRTPLLAWTVRGALTVELFRLSGPDLKTRTPEGPTPLPAAGGEWRVKADADSVFELVAKDEEGNHDEKRIEIRTATR